MPAVVPLTRKHHFIIYFARCQTSIFSSYFAEHRTDVLKATARKTKNNEENKIKHMFFCA